MNRPKKLDLKNLISWGGSKNPAFFYFAGNFVEFSCKVKSGGERKAQALISFGVARKRENVPYFLAIREMSGGQEMVQIKMFFPAKQNLFSRKGS